MAAIAARVPSKLEYCGVLATSSVTTGIAPREVRDRRWLQPELARLRTFCRFRATAAEDSWRNVYEDDLDVRPPLRWIQGSIRVVPGLLSCLCDDSRL
jgi:hypothetical protein